MIAKCIKNTYTWNKEPHRFLDVNEGDVCLFEKIDRTFWFKGYAEKCVKNECLTAYGLPTEYFFEMFEII